MNKIEFERAKSLLEIKHKFKMEELNAEKQYHKDIENLKFDHSLQLLRLNRADMKRQLDRKEALEYAK